MRNKHRKALRNYYRAVRCWCRSYRGTSTFWTGFKHAANRLRTPARPA